MLCRLKSEVSALIHHTANGCKIVKFLLSTSVPFFFFLAESLFCYEKVAILLFYKVLCRNLDVLYWDAVMGLHADVRRYVCDWGGCARRDKSLFDGAAV